MNVLISFPHSPHPIPILLQINNPTSPISSLLTLSINAYTDALGESPYTPSTPLPGVESSSIRWLLSLKAGPQSYILPLEGTLSHLRTKHEGGAGAPHVEITPIISSNPTTAPSTGASSTITSLLTSIISTITTLSRTLSTLPSHEPLPPTAITLILTHGTPTAKRHLKSALRARRDVKGLLSLGEHSLQDPATRPLLSLIIDDLATLAEPDPDPEIMQFALKVLAAILPPSPTLDSSLLPLLLPLLFPPITPGTITTGTVTAPISPLPPPSLLLSLLSTPTSPGTLPPLLSTHLTAHTLRNLPPHPTTVYPYLTALTASPLLSTYTRITSAILTARLKAYNRLLEIRWSVHKEGRRGGEFVECLARECR